VVFKKSSPLTGSDYFQLCVCTFEYYFSINIFLFCCELFMESLNIITWRTCF